MMLKLDKQLINEEQYKIDVNVESCPSDLVVCITANNEDGFGNVISGSKAISNTVGVGLHSILMTIPNTGYKNLFIRLEATGITSTVFNLIKVTRVSTGEIICNHTIICANKSYIINFTWKILIFFCF